MSQGLRWQVQRPSIKELDNKICGAREAFRLRGFRPADPIKLAADFRRLRLYGAAEQNEAIQKVLSEISASGYAGTRPPQRSYEPATKDQELFAFEWRSTSFASKMYFKFALVNPGESSTLYVYSLHAPRKKKGR